MKKIFVLLFGVLLLALGTAICNGTGLGIDPFNSFCIGIAKILNIPLGTFILIVQFIIAAIVFLLDKKYLGIGSIIPMISFGYILQFFNWLLPQFLHFDSSLYIRIPAFFLGMFTITMGMAIYMSCHLGMVPYDGLAFVASLKIKKNAFLLRVVLDTSVMICALLVKGPINVGTILLAFGVGPLLNMVNKLFINKWI